jgi:IS5 family transposase
MRSMPGNPHDGNTLAETIDQVSILADRTPKTVTLDRCYRGVELDGIQMPALGPEARHYANAARDDQAKERNRTDDRTPEDRQTPRTERAQTGAGRSAACLCRAARGLNVKLLLRVLRLSFFDGSRRCSPR